MISLYEEIIGTIIDNIKIVMAIQKTHHADDRQRRDSNDYISDSDIKHGLQAAVKIIANNLLLNKFDLGDFVCVKNHKFEPTLNIVGSVKSNRGQLEFIVITIMKKQDFRVKPGTYTVELY